jgi:urea transport system substrate-binding protein
VPALAEPGWSRGQVIGVGAGLVALAVALVVFGLLISGKRGENPAHAPPPAPGEPIKVGLLHSDTGTMAISESPVADATQLAIDELNRAGGVLGRPVQAVEVDGKSEPKVFAAQAERLLAEEKVAAVFGCWTSASRKAVRPVVERHAGLLFYPVQYEGLEQSPRIVCLGPAPNQQLLPAVDYLTGPLGKKRLFVVGSDYVFPRTAHAIVADRVKQLPGVELVGSAFLPLGSRDVAATVKAIRDASPDAIVNALNGTTNNFFFKELRAAGVTPDRVPTLSLSITENELRGLDPEAVAGSYLAASYFQTVDRDEAREFVKKVRARYGADRVTSDAMAAAYSGVHLWARAVEKAGKPDPDAVLAALRGASFAGPGGEVRIDPENLHAWQPWRIGKVRADGLVDVVASSPGAVAPDPFPPTRTRPQWDRFLNDLYVGWNGRWQAPEK